MFGKDRGAGEGRSGLSLALKQAGRAIYVAAVVLAAAVLYVSLAAVSAGAQGSVEDWDDVTEDRFDSAETDAANRQITSAQDARAAAEEEEESLDCELCVEQREVDETLEAADEDTYEGTAELVDARAQAIEDAPGDSEEELEVKRTALDTLENYAEEWSPEGENEGDADTAEVEAARAEVEAQMATVEGSGGGSNEGSDSDSEDAAAEDTGGEETTAAPPASDNSSGGSSGDSGGSKEGGGGDDGGGSDGGGSSDSGGPLSGLANAASGFNLGALFAAALIAIGVLYYVGGLLREGIRERAKRVGRPTQAQAAAPKQKAKSTAAKPSAPKKSSPEEPSTAPEEPREERPERPSGSKSNAPTKGGGESPEDSSALADRLGAGGRNPRSDRGEEPGEDMSAGVLNALFSEDEDDEEGGDEGRR